MVSVMSDLQGTIAPAATARDDGDREAAPRKVVPYTWYLKLCTFLGLRGRQELPGMVYFSLVYRFIDNSRR